MILGQQTKHLVFVQPLHLHLSSFHLSGPTLFRVHDNMVGCARRARRNGCEGRQGRHRNGRFRDGERDHRLRHPSSLQIRRPDPGTENQ